MWKVHIRTENEMNRSLWSSPKDFSYQGKNDKSLELCNSLYGSSRKRGSATSRQAAIVREGAFTDGGADKCLYDERMFYILTSTICSWPEQYLRLRKPRGKNWANKGLGRNWPLPRNPDRTSRKQFIFPKQNGKNYPIIGRVRFTGRTTSYYANGDRIPRSIQRRCGWAEK